MQTRIHQKLNLLIADGARSVRPYHNNEHLVLNAVIRGDMLIDWDASKGECPTLEAINAVTDEQVNTKEEDDRKSARDIRYADDLTMKGLYRAELRRNPVLTFREYLDSLETEEVE